MAEQRSTPPTASELQPQLMGERASFECVQASSGDAIVRDQGEMDPAEPMRPPSLTTPAMARAVDVAREVLRERGYTDEEIDVLLNRKTGRDFPEF
jgi:hypothetical protein